MSFEITITVNIPGLDKLTEAILDHSVATRNAGQPEKAPRRRAPAAALEAATTTTESREAEVPANVVELKPSPAKAEPIPPPAPVAPSVPDAGDPFEPVRVALRRVITKYGDDGEKKVKGQQEAKAILVKHGVSAVTALDTPEKRAAVIADAEAALKS